MATKEVGLRDMICDGKVLFLLAFGVLITCSAPVVIYLSAQCPQSFGIRIENGTILCQEPDAEIRGKTLSTARHHGESPSSETSIITMVGKTVSILLVLVLMLCITLIATMKVALRRKNELEAQRSSQFISNIQSAFDIPTVKSDKVQLLTSEEYIV